MSDALEKGLVIAKANIFGDPCRKAEAIEYFKQALRENPREIQAWVGIANMAEDRATSKYCFQKVLELDPQNEYAKTMVEFFRGTEVKSKWVEEKPAPLQPFFDSLQRAQTLFTASQPPWLNQANQTPHPNQPYHPPAPNFRNAATPVQTSRPVYAQVKPKKKGSSCWLSSFLGFTILIGIFSAVAPFAFNLYAPGLLPLLTPEITSDLPIPVTVLWGISAFIVLFGYLCSFYWFILGYAGVYIIIKKGYLIEFLGCSLVLAGIPLVLPILFGPILYVWADSIREKKH